MLQSRSLLFDSVWLLLARGHLPGSALRPFVAAAAATNAVRSWSDAPWALWLDRLVASALFAHMARHSETDSQRLAMGFTAVSLAAMMFRGGDRVLHHMFHYAGFVALALIAGRSLPSVALNSAIYWGGLFTRSCGTAVALAALLDKKPLPQIS